MSRRAGTAGRPNAGPTPNPKLTGTRSAKPPPPPLKKPPTPAPSGWVPWVEIGVIPNIPNKMPPPGIKPRPPPGLSLVWTASGQPPTPAARSKGPGLAYRPGLRRDLRPPPPPPKGPPKPYSTAPSPIAVQLQRRRLVYYASNRIQRGFFYPGGILTASDVRPGCFRSRSWPALPVAAKRSQLPARFRGPADDDCQSEDGDRPKSKDLKDELYGSGQASILHGFRETVGGSRAPAWCLWQNSSTTLLPLAMHEFDTDGYLLRETQACGSICFGGDPPQTPPQDKAKAEVLRRKAPPPKQNREPQR
jgi:hypothetical protein